MERSAMTGFPVDDRLSHPVITLVALVPFRLVLPSTFPLVQFLAVVIAELSDRREESFTVGFLLATSDAVDEQKLVAVFREHQRHFAQRFVRKHNVGRKIFRVGDLFAKLSQPLEEVFGKRIRFRRFRC